MPRWNVDSETTGRDRLGEGAVRVGHGHNRTEMRQGDKKFAREEGVPRAALLSDERDIGIDQQLLVIRAALQRQHDHIAPVADLRTFSSVTRSAPSPQSTIRILGGSPRFRGIQQYIETLFHAKVAGVDGQKFIRGKTMFRAKLAGLWQRALFGKRDTVWKQNQLLFRYALAPESIDDLLADPGNAEGLLVGEPLQSIKYARKPSLPQHSQADGGVGLQILHVKNEGRPFEFGDEPRCRAQK